MNSLEAKTPDQLMDAVIQSDDALGWVNRRLLIETIGVENAQQFLPALPDVIAVNLEQLAVVMKAFHNEALMSALERVEQKSQEEDPVPYSPKG